MRRRTTCAHRRTKRERARGFGHQAREWEEREAHSPYRRRIDRSNAHRSHHHECLRRELRAFAQTRDGDFKAIHPAALLRLLVAALAVHVAGLAEAGRVDDAGGGLHDEGRSGQCGWLPRSPAGSAATTALTAPNSCVARSKECGCCERSGSTKNKSTPAARAALSPSATNTKHICCQTPAPSSCLCSN
jgi:hypothetical protein